MSEVTVSLGLGHKETKDCNPTARRNQMCVCAWDLRSHWPQMWEERGTSGQSKRRALLSGWEQRDSITREAGFL